MREISPKILVPPKQVIEIRKKKRVEKLMKNKFLKFIILFFGEGL